MTSQTDANGNTVHYQYNLSSGILEYLMDANGNKMVYSYNAIRELQNVHMDVSNLVDTVYAIARKGTTDVVYVGITKNYSSRQYTHQRKPAAKYPESRYDRVPIATNLNYRQARALEQAIICAYGIDTLNNMINSISPSKWKYFQQEFAQMVSLIESFFDPE